MGREPDVVEGRQLEPALQSLGLAELAEMADLVDVMNTVICIFCAARSQRYLLQASARWREYVRSRREWRRTHSYVPKELRKRMPPRH